MIRNGQVALIIGGTGALGAASAERLAAEGAHTPFTFHSSAAKAQDLARRVAALGRQAPNISLKDAAPDALESFVADVVAQYGRIDTLVYAAGPTFPLQFIAKITPAEWTSVIDADLNLFYRAVHVCLPHLRASRGSVVAITVAAVQRAIARDILSLAPKAAVTALIRGIAMEEGRNGVRANCVAPGFIAGGIGQSILDRVGEEAAAQMVKAVPMRRLGTVEEVADAVAYVSSPQSSYVTGQTIAVSGGMEL